MKLRFTFRGFMAGAEIIDAYRIFPRVILIGYCIWYAYFNKRLIQFYFDLPERTAEVSAFCGLAFAAATGFFNPILKTYNDSARDWAQYHARVKALKEES